MARDADGGHEGPARATKHGWVGAHLVTLSLIERAPLLGQVVDGAMVLAEPGRIVDEEWRRIPFLAANACLDEYVVMPNHIHGIIRLGTAAQNRAGPRRRAARRRHGPSDAALLGAMVAQFKSTATRRINALGSRTAGPLWQPGYRGLAIEDEGELEAIRRYVRENPARWGEDVENPERQGQRAAPL